MHRTSKMIRTLLPLAAAFFLLLGLARAPAPAEGPGLLRFGGADNGRAFDFIQAVFRRVSPCVAYIGCASLDRDPAGRELLRLGSGSGVIVSEEGYIITNYHVVADAVDVEVVLADGRSLAGTVAAQAPAEDLALLKVTAQDLHAAELGDSDQVQVGQIVFPIGNPGGAQFARSMTMGMISGVDREIELTTGNMAHLLQTDAAINPGNSGGPLVDCEGRVIGINSIKIVDPEFESMGFAIPINGAVAILSELCPAAFSDGEKSP